MIPRNRSTRSAFTALAAVSLMSAALSTGADASSPPDSDAGGGATRPTTAASGTIVYQSGGMIHRIEADGSGAAEVASAAPAGQEHPDWSPDGTRVVFDVDFASLWIATVSADGTDANPVDRGTAPAFECVAPCYVVQDGAWAPDGESIAFVAIETTDDINTSRAAILELDVESGAITTLYEDTTGTNWLWSPRWSPDGTSIVFEEYGFASTLLSEGATTGARIGVVDVADEVIDGDATYLVEDPDASGPGGLGHPDWSPDGTTIVFHRDGNLWQINPDGTGEAAITEFDDVTEHAIQPTFTPDGSAIVFTYVTGQFDVDDRPTAASIGLDGEGFETIGGGGLITHPRLRP